MKRSLAFLLTSLLLVFSLTACGKDQQPEDADNNVSGGSVTDGSAGNGGLTDESVTGGINGDDSGSMMDGAMDTMDDVGDAARSAVRDAGDTVTGTTGYTKNGMDGYTYDQMVQNGRVF